MLNAFRHHRLFHNPLELLIFLIDHVLNAFRHHRLFHTDTGLTATAGRTCSTPFGITDYSTLQQMQDGYIIPLCSTPFGITDYSTVRNCSGRPEGIRAQRLSASQTIPRPWGVSPGAADRCAQRLSASQTIPRQEFLQPLARTTTCSTPFGITDYSTPWLIGLLFG